MRILLSAIALLLAADAAHAAEAVRCDAVVEAYNMVAGHHGVPDILSGWTPASAATYRFRDGGGRAAADSGVVCNADGSLARFEFSLTWSGDAPLAQMASAQLAAETISAAVSPDGKPPGFEDLQDMAVHNAEMLNLSTQAEWHPTGNGYEAFASITRTETGGAVMYGIRRQR